MSYIKVESSGALGNYPLIVNKNKALEDETLVYASPATILVPFVCLGLTNGKCPAALNRAIWVLYWVLVIPPKQKTRTSDVSRQQARCEPHATSFFTLMSFSQVRTILVP